ncbi:MAG: imidazole glycerol phosphate synthase subunit HisH [Clostridia bacterium]|nr:imidazole glycerol phosphate synthase subunit HisH [Clostridia bacterium]
MIAIIDYGVGNLFSLGSSLAALGIDSVVTDDEKVIRNADKIILPGVGAFRDASEKLSERGFDKLLKELAAEGKPIMGICLGMQLLFEESYEFGRYKGLGLIKGSVKPIADVIPTDLKIPHIGWNGLNFPENKAKNEIFKYINEGDCVYFVHSYYATDCEDAVIANTQYGAPLTAAVASGNVYGCQFHPEKSGNVGLSIIKAFSEL